MKKVCLLLGITALSFAGCRGPECIECAGIDGYPEGELCRDTYETTIVEGTPSWKDYTAAALDDGCTVKND